MNSFLQGKKALAIPGLQAPQSRPTSCHALARPGAQAAVAPAPAVEVVKQGDKVVRLVVVCSCGERIEVECLYPPGS